MCTRLWLLENQMNKVDPLDVKWTGDGRPYVDEFNTDPVKFKGGYVNAYGKDIWIVDKEKNSG
jgi:hypothetical protein